LQSPFNQAGHFSDDPESGKKLDGLALNSDHVDMNMDDMGRFKTATLRGVSFTPPYMHTGGFETLWDVVEFYNSGGVWARGYGGYSGQPDPRIRPLNLTAEEVGDIVEFLDTLNGEPVPMDLRQPLSN